MNETLMTLLVNNIAFLELSGDDVINPDASVREIEQMSAGLSELSDDDKKAFIDFVKQYAARESAAGQPKKRVEFIKGIPEALGLVDGDDE